MSYMTKNEIDAIAYDVNVQKAIVQYTLFGVTMYEAAIECSNCLTVFFGNAGTKHAALRIARNKFAHHCNRDAWCA